jgi:hypothetical protein
VLYPSELRGRPVNSESYADARRGQRGWRLGGDAISPRPALLYKSLVGFRYFVEHPPRFAVGAGKIHGG